MDPFVKKVKWGGNPMIRVAIGVVVLTAALAIGWGGMQYNSYKQSGGIPSGETSPPQVAISNPQNGGQFKAGESLIVEATAVGPNDFLSVELWLDGKLAGVQTAPEGGMHPFSTHFSWLPLEPGSHSLIAGAVDASGQKAMSAQVIVFISPNEDGIEILTLDQYDSPTVLPAPPEGANGAPSGPGAGATTGPAGNWSGSPGNWLDSLNADEKPTAPELVVSAGQCAANLQIHDLSDNEEGFVVYRQTINSPAWLKVATLSSQSQVEWLEYTDEGVSGTGTYYVSAFNSQGESESNLVLVNVDPADCTPDGEGITVGSVDVTLQIPGQDAERVYCYHSMDGINWSRWPRFGFLSFDENGFLPEGPILQMRQNNLEGQQIVPLLDLFMECWGWQGGILEPLGDFSVEGISPQLEGDQTVVGEGISAEVAYSPTSLVNLPNLFPIGIETDWGGQLYMNPIQFQQQPLTPISPDIPRVYLHQTTDPKECGGHVPPDAQNFLGQLFYCFPYPEYDPNKGGVFPQPYLVWGFDSGPTCQGGIGEDCKSYPELLALAEENGGQVGFEVIAFSSAGKHVWSVTEPDLTMFVIPPLVCVGDIQFNVRLWYQPGNEGVGVSASPDNQITEIGEQELIIAPPNEVFYGPYSNTVSMPCKPLDFPNISLIENVQYLEITFESVYFIFTDDGEDESLELYGYFRVIAPSMGQWKEEYCFFPEFGTCDDNEAYLAYTRRNLLVADWEEDEDLKKFIIKGSYDLRSWELCQSTNKYSCLYEGQATSYKTDNNTLSVFVTEGDALTFEVRLIDYDELSADDEVCYATIMTPSRTLSEWAAVEDKRVQFGSEWASSGRCIVVINMNAVYQ